MQKSLSNIKLLIQCRGHKQKQFKKSNYVNVGFIPWCILAFSQRFNGIEVIKRLLNFHYR